MSKKITIYSPFALIWKITKILLETISGSLRFLMLPNKRYKEIILLSYLIAGINIFIVINKSLHIDYSFFGIILASLLLIRHKIDSRFMMIPSILFLAYCPFLILFNLDKLAENMAIISYFFIIASIFIRLIEKKPSLNISKIYKPLKQIKYIKCLIIISIALIMCLIINKFILQISNIIIAGHLYLITLSLAMHIIKHSDILTIKRLHNG